MGLFFFWQSKPPSSAVCAAKRTSHFLKAESGRLTLTPDRLLLGAVNIRLLCWSKQPNLRRCVSCLPVRRHWCVCWYSFSPLWTQSPKHLCWDDCPLTWTLIVCFRWEPSAWKHELSDAWPRGGVLFSPTLAWAAPAHSQFVYIFIFQSYFFPLRQGSGGLYWRCIDVLFALAIYALN